mgnify:FL=1
MSKIDGHPDAKQCFKTTSQKGMIGTKQDHCNDLTTLLAHIE